MKKLLILFLSFLMIGCQQATTQKTSTDESSPTTDETPMQLPSTLRAEDEKMNWALRKYDDLMGTNGVFYYFPELDFSFNLPAGFPAHNVFVNQNASGKGLDLVIMDIYRTTEINERVTSETWLDQTAIYTVNENLYKYADALKERFRGYATRGVDFGDNFFIEVYSTENSDNNSAPIFYLADRDSDDLTFVFKGTSSDSELLIKLAESAEFDFARKEELETNFAGNEKVSYNDEGFEVVLQYPAKKSSSGERFYEFPELGINFNLASKYSEYNVFTQQSEDFGGEINLIIEKSNDPKDALSVGDGSVMKTTIWTFDNPIEEMSDAIQLEDNDSQKSNYTANGNQYIRIKQTTFGHTPITIYLIEKNGKGFVFSALDKNSDVMIDILKTVTFDGNEISEAKSVKDYLNDIPDQYFTDNLKQSFIAGIDVQDETNFYIHSVPSGWEGDGSFAVFIQSNGEHIYALETKGCGPGCQQNYFFLKKVNGKFVDATSKVLPAIDYDKKAAEILAQDPNGSFNPLINIPRYGTTIEIRDQFSDKLLYNLKWRDGVFALEEL